MAYRKRYVAGLAAVAILVAACGSSSKSTASNATPSTTATGVTTGGQFQLSQPVKIVFLMSIKGEDQFAIPDSYDGAKMAVDEINKAGGIGGQPIQTVRYPWNAVNTQPDIANFLKAVDQKPTIIIGLISPTSAEAVTAQINSAQMPVISVTSDANLNLGAKAGSDWLFNAATTDLNQAAAAASFVTDYLKAKNVGLMHTNEVFGNNGSGVQKKKITAAGGTIQAERSYAVDATDLTEPVLAMKGTDAVIDWGYPNPVAVQLNQFVQNGLNIPTVSAGAVPVIVHGGLVKGQALQKLYSIDNCNPQDPSRAQRATWANNYQALYGYQGSQNGASEYDAVYFAAAAINQARSTDASAVKNALSKVHYTNGVCSADFHSDGAHDLNHSLVAMSWATGSPMTVQEITAPDSPAGQP